MAVVLAVLAALTSAAAPSAGAADLAGFDAGMIITDQVFYDQSTMTPAGIQSFLDAKGASCTRAAGGPACLKDYVQTTSTRVATAQCPGGYRGASSERASTIVWKVAQACGINPQVLVVMLQKEQGLVARTAPTQRSYDAALGQGCPDTAACSALYTGFFNQLYGAASQLQRYRLSPNSYAVRPFLTNNIRFSPSASCGSSPVRIQNQATAGLYNYTPYQPNAAALAAGYGSGDACSAYGNRNFWNYFTSWFGSTGSAVPNAVPIGSVDSIALTAGGTISVRGWTLDPDTSSSIRAHVYVDGTGYDWSAGGDRPDVARIFGKGAAHGFSGSVAVTGPTHRVCVYGIDATGGANTELACATLTNAPPIGSVDTAAFASPGTIAVAGWALDPDTSSSIRAHVYVDGKGYNWAADGPRPDVARIFGKGAAHGFSGVVPVAPGPHQVCVYGIDSLGGANTTLQCSTVVNHAPVGVVESAAYSSATAITVSGYTLDPDTSSPIRVHVYVDGKGYNRAADVARPDVAAKYGTGAAHGFSVTVPVAPGPHQVCAYGIDSVGGANTTLRCSTVSNALPFGALDRATISATGVVSVSGWALDPDTAASIHADVYVDGRGLRLQASSNRPDVARLYPATGAAHGFSGSLAVAPGKHQVCAYAIDSVGGTNALLRCVQVG